MDTNPNNPPVDPDPDKSGRGPPVKTSGEAKPGTATSLDGSVPAAPQISNPTASMSAPAGGDAKNVGPTGKMSPKEGRRKQSAEYQREKELRKQAYEQKMAKIKLALWPTNEAVKTMEQFIGAPINYEKLANSTRFNDAWSTFNKLKVPSGKDKDRVKAVAKEVLSRASQSRRGGKDHKDKKRHRDPSSSSSVGSQGNLQQQIKQLPKIQKVSTDGKSSEPKQPVAAAKAVTSAPSSPEKQETKTNEHRDNPVVDMEDDTVVEDEEDEPALETFTSDLEGALTTGYANAVKGKPKKDQPFLVFIHTGTEVREKVTKEQWKLFLEKLNVKLFDLALEGKDTPNIEWSGHSNGTGVIAPMDAWSQGDVINLVNTIEVADVKFTAWPKGKKDNKTFVTIKLPRVSRASLRGKWSPASPG